MTSLSPEELWKETLEALRPFEGGLSFAIHADLFFHLSLAAASPARFHGKNLGWPLQLAALSMRNVWSVPKERTKQLFVCDYGSEPGFGTLRPLILPKLTTLAMNRQAYGHRSQEAHSLGATAINIDAGFTPSEFARALSGTRGLCSQIMRSAGKELRRLLQPSRGVMRAMLCRAWIYQERLDFLLRELEPEIVVTHNDFTTLSYLACIGARAFGVPDVALQHGLVSLEYMPVRASHYVTWGHAHSHRLRQGSPDSPTQFHELGAPRLDTMVRPTAQREPVPAGHPIRLLFLSGMHSPSLSPTEREMLFLQIANLARQEGVQLSVRRHPQESQAITQRWSTLSVPLRASKESLEDAVRQSDVVLSAASTAALEAASMGCPAVLLKSSGVPGLRAVEDVTHVASMLDDLRCPVRLHLWHMEQQAAMQSLLTNAGQSTGAVRILLDSLRREAGNRVRMEKS